MRSLGCLVLAFAIGCQGDPQKCETAIRNYATLVYWKKTDVEIAAVPPEKRDELRKQKLAEFTAQMEKGLQTLVSQCVSANNKDQVKCMTEAKTAEEATDCSGH